MIHKTLIQILQDVAHPSKFCLIVINYCDGVSINSTTSDITKEQYTQLKGNKEEQLIDGYWRVNLTGSTKEKIPFGYFFKGAFHKDTSTIINKTFSAGEEAIPLYT